MLPEYESRVEVLKRLQFIDDNATVLLKGRVACEINSAPELILTDLILENILADFTPREAVALLSIFVFVEKTDSQPQITDKLADGLEHIFRIADDVEREQDRCSVGYDEFKEKYKPGLVEVVYEWAGGMVSRLHFGTLTCLEIADDSPSSRSRSSRTYQRARLCGSLRGWTRRAGRFGMRLG